MIKLTKLSAYAAAFTLICATTAAAAPLSGLFSVSAINVTNLDRAESEASVSNFATAQQLLSGGGAFADGNSVAVDDTFIYDGALDFRVTGSQDADYTIEQWLNTGTGTVSGLENINNLQLSRSDIDAGTAETTFFLFTLFSQTAMDLTITHDDGVAVFDDGVEIGFTRGPTAQTTTTVNGFDGGALQFIYVATNGNPSILEVEATPPTPAVPLPATLPMLLGALGLVGWRARRRAA